MVLQSRQILPRSIRLNMKLSTRGPFRNLPGGEARWSPNGTLPLMRPTGAWGRANSLFCMDSLIDRTIKYKMENAVTFSSPSLTLLDSALWIVRHQATQSITPILEALTDFEPFLFQIWKLVPQRQLFSLK